MRGPLLRLRLRLPQFKPPAVINEQTNGNMKLSVIVTYQQEQGSKNHQPSEVWCSLLTDPDNNDMAFIIDLALM